MTTSTTQDRPGSLSRREFLQTTAKATAAAGILGAAPFAARGRVLGANDTVGVGFIGVGGRGRSHLDLVRWMSEHGYKARLVAVCDAYGPRLRSAAQSAGPDVKPYRRHHELLADAAVDAVLIATPDRLHLPQALDAIAAGKDVYCEKPMGHWSQFALAKRFSQETLRLRRVVQIGNQGNSSQAWHQVAELIQQGAIGRVSHIQAGYYREGDWGERMPIPDPKATPGPDLDWEAFLGDAPRKPFSVERFFSWRSYLDYAGGPCTDFFPHVFTPFVSIFGLAFPARAAATGGIFKYDHYGREVPDTFNLCLDYTDKKLAVNLTCTQVNEYPTEPCIRGDEGAITLQNPAWEVGFDTVTVIPKKGERRVIKGEKPNTTLKHWENFLECIRTRETPLSSAQFGYHVQTAFCMGMMSFLKDRVARFDCAKERMLL